MIRFLFALSLITCCSSFAVAQTSSFGALEGHSIISTYAEEISSRRMGTFEIVWHDTIYFSTKGRIFHRISQENSRKGDSRRDIVGDEGGRNDGQGTAFRWVGNGVTREWINPRGVRIRQSIQISPAGGGYACRASIERRGRGGQARVVQESCRVLAGNALAQ